MDVNDLIEIEAIKRVKYRYMRTLDQKLWDEMATCFTDDAAELWHGKPGSVGKLLLGSDRREHLELWDWRMTPGDGYPSQDHLPGTREMLHVQEGTLTLSVDGVDHVVPAGSSVLFEADRPHGYANKGRKVLRFTMVASAPAGQYDRRDGAVHGSSI